MHFSLLLSVSSLIVAGFTAPALHQRDNLCNLKAPPSLCQPNSSVTVEETALRAYKFYRAFVVDGDPKTMFSLIDSTYKVRFLPLPCLFPSQPQPQSPNPRKIMEMANTAILFAQQHHPGYSDGPAAIWSLFCNGKPVGTAANSAWCFVASTNMSYAQYSTTDRWRWVDGCVHEHVSCLDFDLFGEEGLICVVGYEWGDPKEWVF